MVKHKAIYTTKRDLGKFLHIWKLVQKHPNLVLILDLLLNFTKKLKEKREIARKKSELIELL